MLQTVPTKDRGFTLIELLLVLALVVALTVAGIAAYQVQLRNFKVDKTALQMQQWLQAGLAFRADCGQWPQIAQTYNDPMILKMTGQEKLGITCPKYSDTFRAYMPLDSQYGPWPSTFLFAHLPGNYYSFGPGTDPDDKTPNPPMFYVQTYLEPADAGMIAAGQMIAGRLPNAMSSFDRGQNKVLVRAYVGKGGAGGTTPSGGGVHIIDMEMVNSNQSAKHIEKPDQKVCDAIGPNLMPVLVGSMSGFRSGESDIQLYTPNKGYFSDANGKELALDPNGFIDEKNIPVDSQNKLKPVWVVYRAPPKLQPPDNERAAKDHAQILMISACVPDPKKAKLENAQTQNTTSSSGISRY